MSGNRLIVKNTFFLYVRMFLTMGISLYASRIVLQQLGVEDFGVYSVVGSLSMFFLFLNYGVSTAIQRFLAYEIGIKNDEGLQKCFSSGIVVTILICVVLVVVGEIAGVFAIGHLLDIPPGREDDALFVYQFSLLMIVIELFRSCFQNLILAYEKMSFFAYLSIAEAVLKLTVVFLLAIFGGDKLRIYVILLTCSSLVILICYVVYSRINFPAVKITIRGGRERLRSIISFTGWNTLSSFADLCYMQGLNIVLNMFYGVVLNAAMGVTNQVKTAVLTFSKNVQFAANPHIIKEFAKGEYENFSNLIYGISRISFLVLFLPGLPIMLNTHTILSIWLTVIPSYTEIFIRLMICFALIDSLVGPLWIGMQATGKIKAYQITTSLIWIAILPTTYIIFKNGGSPQWVILTQIIFSFILIIVRLSFAHKQCHIPIKSYITRVAIPLVKTMSVSAILPVVAAYLLTGISSLIVTTILTLVSLPVATYYLGLTAKERTQVLGLIKFKLNH